MGPQATSDEEYGRTDWTACGNSNVKPKSAELSEELVITFVRDTDVG
jgi:hypothetical protein